MRFSLHHKVIGFFGFVILVVIGNFVFYAWETQKLTQREKQVIQTYEALAKSEEFLTQITNAETGQRGYLLTSNSDYLVPFEIGQQQALSSLNQLKLLSADDVPQQTRLTDLHPLMQAKLAELSQTVALAQSGNLDDAMVIVRSNAGEHLMAQIREIVLAYQSAEQHLLVERVDDYENSQRLLLTVFAIEGFLLVIGMILFVLVLQKTIINPLEMLTKNAAQIGAGNFLDEAKPYRRSDEIGTLTKAIFQMNKQLKTRSHNLERLAAIEKSLSQILAACSMADRLDDALKMALSIHTESQHCPVAAIFLHDPKTDRLHQECALGLHDDLETWFSSSQGKVMETFDQGKAVVVTPQQHDTGSHLMLNTGIGKIPLHSIHYQPIAYADKKIGVLVTASLQAIDTELETYYDNLGSQLGSTVLNFRQIDRLEQLTKELERSRETALKERDQAVEASISDPLTGVRNRGYFDLMLDQYLIDAQRHDYPVSLVMVDIDHFKNVNDTFGHQVGDEVLITLCQTLRNLCRSSDLIARYGGEEFVLVLPKTTQAQAQEIADTIRQAVAALKIDALSGQQLTISAGVSAYPECGNKPEILVKKADEALYTAKNTGRNKVCVATVNG